jgi:hypothetical protein
MHSDRSRHETSLTVIYALLLGATTVGYRLIAPYQLLGADAGFAWNLMPVGALALFVGSRLPSLWAWLIPLGAMVVSDVLLIPAYAAQGSASISWASTPFVYASFLLYATTGRFVRPSIDSPLPLLGSALVGSVQFFVLTNLAVWAFEVVGGVPLYPKTLPGLIDCFVKAADPQFSRGTFIGDLFFTSLFFAAHAAVLSVARRAPAQEAV